MTITAVEQLLIELINRARLDPQAEADRLGIGLNDGIPYDKQIATTSMQVLASDRLLEAAADGHSGWMLSTDVFSHTGSGGSSPTQRMSDAGYTFSGSWTNGENIAWAGSTGSVNLASMMLMHYEGLFRSPGHRENTLNANFSEIGVAQVSGKFTVNGISYNASMLTEDFAHSGNGVFITGVVYDDYDHDLFYSVGEGRGSVTVAVAGQGQTSSTAAGGYTLQVDPGYATVTLTSHGVASEVVIDATRQNAKLDLVSDSLIYSSASLTLVSGVANAALLGRDDLVLNGNDDANRLTGNAGDNVIRGGGGRDVIAGGDGNDRLQGDAGNDIIRGGAGDDIVWGGTGRDRVRLQAGDDTFIDSSEGGANGRDVVWGGSGRDTIRGGGGNDRLYGESGHDRIEGGAGDDQLFGGTQNDQLQGGAGADSFVFMKGDDRDLVIDFELGIDRLLLDADLAPGKSAAQIVSAYGHSSGNTVVLDFGGGDVLTFCGLDNPYDLVADIFLI